MADILALLHCLNICLTKTVLRQLSHVVFAMLAMTGRVTMLGLSRWAGKGGSYRSVQRFFYTVIPWAQVFWLFFCRHGLDPDAVYILAGDECVVTKSGKKTYGLDRFFSSLYGKPVPGLAFFALSLVSVKERHSFPARVEQVVRTEAEKAATLAASLRSSRRFVGALPAIRTFTGDAAAGEGDQANTVAAARTSAAAVRTRGLVLATEADVVS